MDALDVQAGQSVLDVGCGTGLCLPELVRRVGPHGRVVGIDESAPMLAMARRRVADLGCANVILLRAPISRADLPAADAAVFCAVHDILQSPPALRRVLRRLPPHAGWLPAAAAGHRPG